MPETTAVQYGFSRKVNLAFDEALRRTRDALKAEGFGILCEIDIKEKLREKLGVDFRRYVILGACNPPLAHQALQHEMLLGLLLPCNAVVYEDGAGAVVAAIDAGKMLSVVGNDELQPIARQVNERLQRVIAAVA